MKYLDKVLEINEIDGQHREAASKEYLAAKERVKELPISLGEDAETSLIISSSTGSTNCPREILLIRAIR